MSLSDGGFLDVGCCVCCCDRLATSNLTPTCGLWECCVILRQGFAEFNSPEEARRAMVRDRAYIGERFVKLIRVPRHEMESQLGATGFVPPKAGGGGNVPPPQQQQQVETLSALHLTNELSSGYDTPCKCPQMNSTLPPGSARVSGRAGALLGGGGGGGGLTPPPR